MRTRTRDASTPTPNKRLPCSTEDEARRMLLERMSLSIGGVVAFPSGLDLEDKDQPKGQGNADDKPVDPSQGCGFADFLCWLL